MRRHAPQWTSEVAIWEGMRHKVYEDALCAGEDMVDDLDPQAFSTYLLCLDGEGRDAGGHYVIVREPDTHVAIVRDHDTGDTDGYGRWL